MQLFREKAFYAQETATQVPTGGKPAEPGAGGGWQRAAAARSETRHGGQEADP